MLTNNILYYMVFIIFCQYIVSNFHHIQPPFHITFRLLARFQVPVQGNAKAIHSTRLCVSRAPKIWRRQNRTKALSADYGFSEPQPPKRRRSANRPVMRRKNIQSFISPPKMQFYSYIQIYKYILLLLKNHYPKYIFELSVYIFPLYQ